MALNNGGFTNNLNLHNSRLSLPDPTATVESCNQKPVSDINQIPFL